MAVKIRLRRIGKRSIPCHRIVVADGRSPRDGRFIEQVGTYDPIHEQESVDVARVDYWVGCGAQMSDTVRAIVRRARAGISLGSARAAAQKSADAKSEKDEKPAKAAKTEAAPAAAAGETKE